MAQSALFVFAQQNASSVSVSPSSGTGSSQVFTFTFSSLNGFADLGWAQMNFSPILGATNACYVHLDRLKNFQQQPANQAYLLSDSGDRWIGPVILGRPGSLVNSQCVINAALSAASGTQNDLTVSLAISFNSVFAGQKTVFMQTRSYSSDLPTGWQARGVWNATGGGSLPPQAISVTPSSGVSQSQVFSFVYSDPGGYANLSWAQVNWSLPATANGALSASNSCYIHFDRAGNALWLLNDSGNLWLGPLAVGNPGVLLNGQCFVDGPRSSWSGAGTNLTLNVAMTFIESVQTTRNIYTQVENSAILRNGGTCYSPSPTPLGCWGLMGTWTVPGTTVNHPPSPVSVVPGLGAGSKQSFTFQYSDSDGFRDLPWAQVNINSSLSPSAACYFHFDRTSNAIWLLNDTGSGWLGPAVLGNLDSVRNSQCYINAQSSAANGTGTDLTLQVSLTFFPAFAGVKNIYMQTEDINRVASGWKQRGSWTSVAGNSPPLAVSATPSTGSGLSQMFSLLYSDADGFADLPWAQVNINATFAAVNGCYIHYDRLFNSVWLLNNDASAWLGPIKLGATSNLTNSQCQLSGGSSSVSTGNNLRLNLALTFLPGFSGTKNLYLQTIDTSGAVTGWQNLGKWTIP
jgi:hypothetical protein